MQNEMNVNENVSNAIAESNTASEQATKNVVKKLALDAKKKAKKSATNVAKKKIAKKVEATKDAVNINLAQFSKKLADMNVKEKAAKERLYIYPETFTERMINGDEGKTFRNSKRRLLHNFCNNVFVYTKTKQIEKLKVEVKNFVDFYKTTFRTNDFSMKSITQLAADKEKYKDIEFLLQIVKEVKK